MSRQVPSIVIPSFWEAVRYCAWTAASSSGSLSSTGLRPRLTWTPSNPRLLANPTASSFPVCLRFQSVTPIFSAALLANKAGASIAPPADCIHVLRVIRESGDSIHDPDHSREETILATNEHECTRINQVVFIRVYLCSFVANLSPCQSEYWNVLSE